MDEKLMRSRRLCLEHAQKFVEAAERLVEAEFLHIVYHLSLLALEEVGKASMLGALMIKHPSLDGSWIERSLDDHRRKLQWAVWSPMAQISPADFEAARQFAERAHATRLASLYVDSKAGIAAPPPVEQVTQEDAAQVLSLARARLEYERGQGTPSGQIDDLTGWFLDVMDDPNRSRVLLSQRFIAQYEAEGSNARAWATWARDEIDRLRREDQMLLEAELAKSGAPKEAAKPRWRANAMIYTPSHSLRSKVLARWNDQIKPVQLIWSGNKDQFTLQVTLSDSEPLASLFGRLASLSKLVVACLNIGSIGYFWFERPGFEHQMFKSVRDLELDRSIEIGRRESFWGNGRAVALTEEHIDHAIRCMMAFAPLPELEAEAIFRPYLDGIALIAKSDMFYSFDELARRAFIVSLAGALARYGGWSGKPEDIEASFHEAFAPVIPELEHREKMLKTLSPEGDPSETPLANLRSAKQLTDLYLIQVSQRTWRRVFEMRSDGKA